MAPVLNSNVRPIVICGPSGAGKSTLLKKLFAEYPAQFGFSVSHTTRTPRPGEENGVHYHFVARDNMLAEVAEGKFIENAEFSGNLYGTSFKAVQDVLSSGKNVILDIDSQGVYLLKKAAGSAGLATALYIFLMPPSVEELERRLRGRGTETEESIQKRLDAAKREMEWGVKAGSVDTIIINDDVETAYEALRKAIFGAGASTAKQSQ
ncbi:guanylate kinase [Cladochytrium replicatum]|nr:guanylate kinase [Cladochytrium replicatum]